MSFFFWKAKNFDKRNNDEKIIIIENSNKINQSNIIID